MDDEHAPFGRIPTDADLLRAEYEAAMHVPGAWICPKCNYTLFKNNLSTSNGAVTPDLAVEYPPCPNDQTPLKRLTWEQHCKGLSAVCESQVKRAVAAEDRIERITGKLRDALLTCLPNSSHPDATMLRQRIYDMATGS